MTTTLGYHVESLQEHAAKKELNYLNIKGENYLLKEKRKAGVLAKNATPISD